MAPERRAAATVRARRASRRASRRRRRTIVAVVAIAIVGVGAGTAAAMQGSDGPDYRLATVTRGAVAQTVDADGTLAAKQVYEASFGVSGTVDKVGVAVGDTVTAGQALATLDTTSLTAAVTSAKTTLAQAEQTLTDAEDGVVDSTGNGNGSGSGSGSASTGTATTATTTSHTTSAVSGIELVADRTPVGTSVAQLRAQVERDATAVAAAVKSYIAAACETTSTSRNTGATTAVTQQAGSDGDVSVTVGSAGGYVSVTDADGTAVTGWDDQAETAGTYSISGLTAGEQYTVTVVPVGVDATSCTAAIQNSDDTTKNSALATAVDAFGTDLTALQQAVAASSSPTTGGTTGGRTGGTTGSKTGGSTGSKTGGQTGGSTGGSTGSETGGTTGGTSGSGTQGSGTASGSTSSSTTVTAEQIAADVASVGSAKAALAVAKKQLSEAMLTSTIGGTVAAVDLTAGEASGGSITVVGTGALSVDLSIPLAKIDLVKVGQKATVTVDGRSSSLPAKVTYVGTLNSGDSTGSSSTYTVTVQLDAADAHLYDGMGASVAIDVGSASGALVVPLSAVHTSGTRSTVEVLQDGKAVATSVTLGVVGGDSVQVTKGLTAGERIVLATVSEAVPSSGSTTNSFRRSGSGSLGGLTGGSGAGGSGGGFGGRPGGN